MTMNGLEVWCMQNFEWCSLVCGFMSLGVLIASLLCPHLWFLPSIATRWKVEFWILAAVLWPVLLLSRMTLIVMFWAGVWFRSPILTHTQELFEFESLTIWNQPKK